MKSALLRAVVCAAAAVLQAAPGAAQGADVRFAGQAAELTVTPVSEHTFRITLEPTSQDAEAVPVSDGRVLAERDWGEPLIRATALTGAREVAHGDLRVRVTPSPLTVRITTAAGAVVQELVFGAADGSVEFRVGDGPVYGLGNGGQTFDRRGTFFPMQRGHRQGEYLVFGARTPVPFLIGTGGDWSMFFHRPYNGQFDLRGETGLFLPADVGGYFPQRGELVRSEGRAAEKEAPLPLDVFVTHVDTPSRALSEYTIYTGRPAMPPKWALGYMQSHRNLTTVGPEGVMNVARTFREKRLPVDALIYLGTGFTAGGWNTGHGEFSFHPGTFTQAQAMIDEMRALNYNVVLHVTEPPDDLFGEIPPAPGESVTADHAQSYWAQHREVYEMGVAGWWPDMGDELDHDARLARHAVYHEGPLSDRPNERPWSLHRTGFAGMHRFGGWNWSGDVNGSWKTLAAHVPVGINASLSTSPFWGTDIGGFYPTEDYTGELFVRWFQFGAFVPSFRSHGVTWRTRVPWGWNPGELGPLHTLEYLKTGSLAVDTVPVEYRLTELHDARVEPIIKKYLELRYQLMPYTYTAIRETHDTGVPIMRALWFHYPNDSTALTRTHEYLWGRDMLIAPVVERGTQGPHYFSMRDIYLPDGIWYDFWRPGRPIRGGQTMTQTFDLETMPIYVRAGAILPMDPIRQYVDEPVAGPMTVRVYPGADGEYSLYDDDGRTFDFENGEASWTRFVWNNARRTLTIEPGAGVPLARQYHVVVAGERSERTVNYDGTRVEVTFN